jgi:RNA polymerase sigma factor (sigma-70 family)
VDYKRQVEDNLPLVDSVVRTIARKHGLTADESDELASSVKLKLVENDYDVLRKFEGRSQLRTYLITVVDRLFLDERNARWGKWRPSAIARRLGPAAILLDQLLTRDHLSFDDAAAAIAARFGDEAPRAELQKIALQLPVRASRMFVDEGELEHLPAPTPDGADVMEARERQHIGDRVERALGDALRNLSDEDRAILRLRFCENVKIARIAELLGIPDGPDRKRFYRRLEDLMGTLRKALQARGVSRQDVVAIMEHPDTGVGDVIAADAGKTGNRPSVP